MDFEDRISKLLDIKSNNDHFTSLYLNLSPDQRENLKYKLTLKNLIKRQKEQLDKWELKRDISESIESDFEKISKYIENQDHLTGCRGLAIFSCYKRNLWEVFKLSFVYRDRLVVNHSPLLGQLIDTKNKFGDNVVVALDRKKARIFEVTLENNEEIKDYFYPAATRPSRFHTQEGQFKQKGPSSSGAVIHGYGEYGFQRTIEDETHQHFKYVSQKLLDYYRDKKFDWLIVAGREEVLRDFSSHLHSYLKRILLGTIGVEIDTVRSDQIFEKVANLHEIKNREREKEFVEEFEEKLGERLATDGIKSTLKALARGQVRILLVLDGVSYPGFKCPESGVLALEPHYDLCPEGTPPLPVIDVVDDAIEEAFRQGAEVKIILDGKLKEKIALIGAIFRFRI